MGLIDFFEFGWEKLIITFLLLAAGFFYVRKMAIDSINLFFYGFPLAFFLEIFTEPSLITTFQESQVLNMVIIGGLLVGLIADLVFWYLLSCLTVWVYKKWRK